MGDQTTIDVLLVPNIESLQEIVVIGYGTAKKSDLTGAITSLKGEDIINVSAPTLDRALQGKASGVMIVPSSGQPGATSKIRIRGVGSLDSNNDPLIVIDGIPMGNDPNALNLVNNEDVESVEILKDGSTAAIYGSPWRKWCYPYYYQKR
ncbi:MAG: TonB-dependent receptor plug domain-containing protein [Bacteroidales bacterium]|nr:TonB-dependent receptor plug domain-containing protein [Bacteroidales bacterium]